MKITKTFSTRLILILLISSSVSLSFTPSESHDYLLSSEDRQLEQRDAERGPGLSSVIGEEPHWESFNKWLCFSTQFVTAECTELGNGESWVPTFRIAVNGALYDYKRHYPIQLYEFDMEDKPGINCHEVVKQWNLLLEGENSVCVYAAYLQDLPISHFVTEKVDHWSLWYSSQIKTSKGYWKEYEPRPQIEDDEAFNEANESDDEQENEN